MNKERFESLLTNKEIPKGNDFTSFILKSESEQLIVHILFNHSGYSQNGKLISKRVILFPYPIEVI